MIRGVLLQESEVLETGIRGDRELVVVSASRRRFITARTHHRLLGLQGGISPETHDATINGSPWDSATALALVEAAVGEKVRMVHVAGTERFDVLPLLVATDAALDALGVDRRRFRYNLLIGGVEGLSERKWEGKRIQLGAVEIHAAQLRARCVMTTYDPDTLKQDRNVLLRIVKEFDGTMALDCSVLTPGTIRMGDPVNIL